MTAAERMVARPATNLTDADRGKLLRYFRSKTDLSAASSATGALLERQSMYYRDSEGRRIPAAEDWVYMHVNESGRSKEPSYTPTHGGGDSSVTGRRLMELGDERHRQVLETYYGDIGEHWESIFDGARKIGCLFHLTDVGREVVAGFGGGMGPSRIIEQYWRDQDSLPSEERRRTLRLMQTAATEDLCEAQRAFSRTG